VYRHSSVSCEGIGSARNSSNARFRRAATNGVVVGRAASATSSNPVVVPVMSFSAQEGRPSGLPSCGPRAPRRQPTEPSIWSSIRRFSSTAYSIGSSRVIGSMNPFTIIAVASGSVRPRLIR